MPKPVIAVIVATDEEFAAASEVLRELNPSVTHVGVIKAFLVELDRVFLLVRQPAEMGNLDAALTTSEIIRQYRPICVIGAGTCCGANAEAQNFCDLVVAEGVIYYEPSKKTPKKPERRPRKFEATVSERLRQQIITPSRKLFDLPKKRPRGSKSPEPNVHHGFYASGDSVLAARRFVDEVCSLARDTYEINPVAIEMEGAGIAMACEPSGTKFTLVKAIMDFAKNKTQSTRKWQDSAAIISFGSVRQWAESLTEEDIMELHVRDLPHSEDKKKDSQARDLLPPEPDPYKRANKLARLAGSMLPPRGVELRNPMPPINTALAKCEKRVEEFLAKGLCQGGESDFVGEAIDRHHAKRIDPKAQQIDPDTTQTINLKIGNWWIVDAVDGRENMTAARPEVAVSIAYYKNSIAKLALIHLPYRGLTVATTFPIHKLLVNGVEWARRRAPAHHLAGAVLALPGDIGRLRETDLDSVMRGLVSKSNAIRVTGALAYDLACMALGEIDARISTSAELVDIAAGVPLVKATGGKVTNLQGQELDLLSGDKCEILAAATHELHAEILKEINLARPAAATS